uniref:SWIM-type domain-containing protein n=1 Tax=Oryza glumipatula TaxID=40148 RepID=A0A0E0AM59_9ORYZ
MASQRLLLLLAVLLLTLLAATAAVVGGHGGDDVAGAEEAKPPDDDGAAAKLDVRARRWPRFPATDGQLALFGKNMVRACKILDEGGVRRVTGAPSGRSLFLVMGESRRKEEYICFPEHLCTCYSFFYDIVGRGEQLCCKHQLAAQLAEAVSKHQDIEFYFAPPDQA